MSGSVVTQHSSPGAPVAPVARSLLAQARRMLADAEWSNEPVDRFTGAYAAALRAAAAVLAARGRPHRGRSRPTSVWVLLESSHPELAEWAGFFAAHSGLHAAAQAGISGRVSVRAADDLVRQAGQFIELAGRAVYTSAAPVRRQHRAAMRRTAQEVTGLPAQRQRRSA